MNDSGTVLVTGGLGYLGSRLLLDASVRLPGRTVRVLDNLQTHGQRALMNLPTGARIEFVEGDVLDRGVLAAAMRGVGTVIHLAALVRTPMSFEHPVWVNQVNHWGTATLVEACLAAGVRRLVHASTTAVFGPGGPFDEGATPRPLGPYAFSKLGAEDAVRAGGDRGLEVSVLRLGMLYGLAPAVRFDGFVNRLAYLAGTGKAVPIYGSGAQRRPVLHVADGSAILLDQATAAVPLSLANVVERNASVNDVIDALKAAKPGVRTVYTEQDVLNHLSFEADASRLRATGWRPHRAFAVGIDEFVRGFGGVFAPAAG